MKHIEIIKKMNTEQMATLISQYFASGCTSCPANLLCNTYGTDCREAIIKWLEIDRTKEQEAKEK